MHQLYIANATRQVQDFHYRIPGIAQVRQQTIQIGGQIKISGDLKINEVEAIIQQHSKYGLISADEIDSGKAFAPMCYQVDKPVAPEMIEMLSNRNMGVLADRGYEQRKEAAIVVTNRIGQNLREQNIDADLTSVEVDTIEDDDQNAQNRRSSTGDPRIREKTIVSREDRQERVRGRGGRR